MPVTALVKKIFIFQLGLIFALVALSAATQAYILSANVAFDSTLWQVLQRFNIDAEVSLPTWYSQTALVVCAALLFFIAYAIKKKRKMGYKQWFLLSALFLYMSIDEGASLHELFVSPMRSIFDIKGGYFLSAWVIPFIVLVAVCVIIYARFWWRLPKRTRALMFAAAVVFVGGAIGMEMIGAHIYTENHGRFGYIAIAQASIEEIMEMVGVALFTFAFLDYSRVLKILPGTMKPDPTSARAVASRHISTLVKTPKVQ